MKIQFVHITGLYAEILPGGGGGGANLQLGYGQEGAEAYNL